MFCVLFLVQCTKVNWQIYNTFPTKGIALENSKRSANYWAAQRESNEKKNSLGLVIVNSIYEHIGIACAKESR